MAGSIFMRRFSQLAYERKYRRKRVMITRLPKRSGTQAGRFRSSKFGNKIIRHISCKKLQSITRFTRSIEQKIKHSKTKLIVVYTLYTNSTVFHVFGFNNLYFILSPYQIVKSVCTQRTISGKLFCHSHHQEDKNIDNICTSTKKKKIYKEQFTKQVHAPIKNRQKFKFQ